MDRYIVEVERTQFATVVVEAVGNTTIHEAIDSGTIEIPERDWAHDSSSLRIIRCVPIDAQHDHWKTDVTLTAEET